MIIFLVIITFAIGFLGVNEFITLSVYGKPFKSKFTDRLEIIISDDSRLNRFDEGIISFTDGCIYRTCSGIIFPYHVDIGPFKFSVLRYSKAYYIIKNKYKELNHEQYQKYFGV